MQVAGHWDEAGSILADAARSLERAGADCVVLCWGCAAYGDHLYDLAWCLFWAPWHPGIDPDLLRAELERRWQADGYAPRQYHERLAACLLHIGLDHLAYNAYRGDGAALADTAARMRVLVPWSRCRCSA